MSQLVHTKGIVLRNTPYSETSIICNIYTEQMGTKGYIVSGVRTSKKTSSKGVFFQSGAVLDLVVYNSDFQNLHRIKEFKWDYLYQQVFFSVFRNAAMLFVVELLSRTLRQPDHNPALFTFTGGILRHIDQDENEVFANIPIYFTIHLLSFLGFRLDGEHLKREDELHSFSPEMRQALEAFLLIRDPKRLGEIKINKHLRHQLFEWLQSYYQRHIHDFGKMKSYPIIKQIFQ